MVSQVPVAKKSQNTDKPQLSVFGTVIKGRATG